MEYSTLSSGIMPCMGLKTASLIPRTLRCGRHGMGMCQWWYGMKPCVGGAHCTYQRGVVLCLTWKQIAIWRKFLCNAHVHVYTFLLVHVYTCICCFDCLSRTYVHRECIHTRLYSVCICTCTCIFLYSNQSGALALYRLFIPLSFSFILPLSSLPPPPPPPPSLSLVLN